MKYAYIMALSVVVLTGCSRKKNTTAEVLTGSYNGEVEFAEWNNSTNEFEYDFFSDSREILRKGNYLYIKGLEAIKFKLSNIRNYYIEYSYETLILDEHTSKNFSDIWIVADGTNLSVFLTYPGSRSYEFIGTKE